MASKPRIMTVTRNGPVRRLQGASALGQLGGDAPHVAGSKSEKQVVVLGGSLQVLVGGFSGVVAGGRPEFPAAPHDQLAGYSSARFLACAVNVHHHHVVGAAG